jgi:hypothetical protein
MVALMLEPLNHNKAMMDVWGRSRRSRNCHSLECGEREAQKPGDFLGARYVARLMGSERRASEVMQPEGQSG